MDTRKRILTCAVVCAVLGISAEPGSGRNLTNAVWTCDLAYELSRGVPLDLRAATVTPDRIPTTEKRKLVLAADDSWLPISGKTHVKPDSAAGRTCRTGRPDALWYNKRK